MGYSLRNRSLLKLLDYSSRDIRYLLNMAQELKRAKYAGNEVQRLKGKNIALIFEKSSTRSAHSPKYYRKLRHHFRESKIFRRLVQCGLRIYPRTK